MDASRAEVMLDFITNKKDADIDQYPIEAAFKDIFKYFAAGTQTEAFRKIRQTTAATASIREKQVLKLPSIDVGQVFNGSVDVTKATISVGRSLDKYRKIYDDWVAAGKPSPDANYDPTLPKLKNIFDSTTTGASAADFKPYWDSLRTGDATFNTHYIDLSSAAPTIELNVRVHLIDSLSQALFSDAIGPDDTKRAKAEALIIKMQAAIDANK
jgi:hypothetical protein